MEIHGLLYAPDLILCGEFEEDLRVMVVFFIEVCKKDLNVNGDERKEMVLGGDVGLVC